MNDKLKEITNVLQKIQEEQRRFHAETQKILKLLNDSYSNPLAKSIEQINKS